MSELALQPDLGIERVGELQDALMPHLDDAEPLALVGDQVTRVHTAGLQLLHAFVRERAARGGSTRVTAASPALASAARQLALLASLGLESPQADISGDSA
jgi:anti-anti-sigma regulatory factor